MSNRSATLHGRVPVFSTARGHTGKQGSREATHLIQNLLPHGLGIFYVELSFDDFKRVVVRQGHRGLHAQLKAVKPLRRG